MNIPVGPTRGWPTGQHYPLQYNAYQVQQPPQCLIMRLVIHSRVLSDIMNFVQICCILYQGYQLQLLMVYDVHFW